MMCLNDVPESIKNEWKILCDMYARVTKGCMKVSTKDKESEATMLRVRVKNNGG
jgi:hypothetical protein